MYAIHTTPGLIIDSRPYGEAGKMISVFTRDLGLITATAVGIRFEKSKLRYHTQDYSLGSFSFVRGKEFWRLTSAEGTGMEKGKREEGREGELIARIALLLRRLLHGEEPHPELFGCVESCARFLDAAGSIDQEALKTLESIVVLRMLHALGYIGNDEPLRQYIGAPEITDELLERAGPNRTLINQHINKALKESHL